MIKNWWQRRPGDKANIVRASLSKLLTSGTELQKCVYQARPMMINHLTWAELIKYGTTYMYPCRLAEVVHTKSYVLPNYKPKGSFRGTALSFIK